MVKGVAILMMLFLHLFNQLDNCGLTRPLLMLGDIPFIYYLTRACGPVPFFLFVSGVGLSISYQKQNNSFKRGIKRLLKLYIHFWFILTCFLIFAHILKPNEYPGSFILLIANYTSLYYTYNSTYWFLAPYALISLTSPFLFKIFEKYNGMTILIITFVISLCTSFVISRYGTLYLYENVWIYTPVLYFHFLFMFSLGAICTKTKFWGIPEKIKRYRLTLYIFLFSLITIRCFFSSSAFHNIYVFVFILLFLALPKSKPTRFLLINFGKNSMNIWLIHAWLYQYLFKDFIYGFEYPLIIFVVLASISYLLSVVANFILEPIVKRI